ncbi:hypothetical protein [Herbiconiux liangxiaofengii]|uniref:hypothetical protein n=1 Tax=Herbiconiux liangxiaofengii TaxID=3342795 RepID=UPI0035BA3A81
MYDFGTWVLIIVVAAVVVSIVVFSVIVGAKRRRMAHELRERSLGDAARSADGRVEGAIDEGTHDAVPDNALGDRSDILHRSRRGF